MVKNTLITLDSNPDTGEGNEGIFKALFQLDNINISCIFCCIQLEFCYVL